MSMELHVQLLPDHSATISGDAWDAAVEQLLGDPQWEAGTMWWAVLDLLFGPDGASRLDGTPVTPEIGHTAIMEMDAIAVKELVVALGEHNEPVLEARFDAGVIGDAMGPPVRPDDRDWLVEAATELSDLLEEAAGRDSGLLWVLL